MSNCATDSVLPQWVTIGFFLLTLTLLIIISITSFISLKTKSSTRNKLYNTQSLTVNKNVYEATETKDQENEDDELQTENKYDRVTNILSTSTSATTDTTNDWTSLSYFGKFKLWIVDVLHRKSVYGPLVAHLADTASDFAAVVEFYEISKTSNPEDCNGLNTWYLFYLSIGCMALYRVISSYAIWRITGSIKRVTLQFIDVELFEVLHLSHQLGLKGASSPQRLIQCLEAVFEASCQSVLQLVYLINTGNLGGIISISSILSFINLTMTIIADDKKFIDAEFANPHDE
eukprot:123161_1